jgi:hypothetical protein
MKALLAAAATCLAILVLTEILPPLIGSSLVLASLAWLAVLIRRI